MIDQGLVHSVRVVTLGSYVAADAAIGATTLTMDSVLDFNEDGGTLTLNGTTRAYLSADFDLNTITLAAPLPVPAVTADRVDVAPVSTEKQALVVMADSEDAVTVRIPHALMDRMPEGIRAEGEQESVQFDLIAGEFVLTDVVGQNPRIDGSYIDPVTVPPAASDNLPPASSPTPTATGGPGFILLRWVPIANHDPVTYNLYGSTTSGFTADGSTLLVSTSGSSFTHRPTPPDYAATYYYKVIATDEDGAAVASAETSVQLVQITSADVVANFGSFLRLTVDQLEGGTLNAGMTIASTMTTRGGGSGAGTDIGVDGIDIYDPAGKPVIGLHPAGSTFKGSVEANGLTVTGGMALRSTNNEISTSGSLTLQVGSTPPKAAPSYVVDWEQYDMSAATGGYGLAWDGTNFAVMGRDFSVRTFNAVGVIQSTTPLDRPAIPLGGVVKLGTSWYTLGVQVSSGIATWFITRFDSTGAQTAQLPYTPINGPWGSGGDAANDIAPAAIGTDGTNILVGEWDEANDRYRIASYTAALSFIGTAFTSVNAGFSGPVTGITRTNADFGSERTIITTRTNTHFLVFSGSLTYSTTEVWFAASADLSGVVWDGLNFYARTKGSTGAPSKLTRHSSIKTTGGPSATWQTTSTWADTDAAGTGPHETTMGPVAAFTMKSRARLTLTSPAIPDQGGTDDPNAVRFYLSQATTARTDMHLVASPADGVNSAVLTSLNFAGALPPATNSFPGAIAGRIDSPDGGLVISGDNTIKAAAISVGTVPVATTTGAQSLTNKNLRSATNTMPYRAGAGTFTGVGAGVITIPHGLGATPEWAIVQVHASGVYFSTIATLTATNITANILHKDGTATLGTGSVGVSWMCGITTS